MTDSLPPAGPPAFVSYAPNREDVVLDRALRGVAAGRYVDVGAGHPTHDSVTYALYDRGWSGIVVEPVPAFAERLREVRPRDVVVQAAITNDDARTVTLHQVRGDVVDRHREADGEVEDVEVAATRLNEVLESAGWGTLDIQVMIVDTEGSERQVLESIDLKRWRPWILVIRATRPLTPEPSPDGWEDLVDERGYEFCLFDGLSRFYVATEQAAQLRGALSVPANPLDHYIQQSLLAVEQERDEAISALHRRDAEQQDAIIRWRDAALRAWVTSAQAAQEQDPKERIELHLNHVRRADEELTAMRSTLSWRITRPLRQVRSVARWRGDSR